MVDSVGYVDSIDSRKSVTDTVETLTKVKAGPQFYSNGYICTYGNTLIPNTMCIKLLQRCLRDRNHFSFYLSVNHAILRSI